MKATNEKEYKVECFDANDNSESVNFFDNRKEAEDYAESIAGDHFRVVVSLLNVWLEYIPYIDYINGCITRY